MKSMNVDENDSPSKKGLYLSFVRLAIIGCVIGVIFVACILATYFGKNCSQNTCKNLAQKCESLACSDHLLLESWNDKCSHSGSITTTTPVRPTTPAPVNYRIPDDLQPYLYDLTFKMYFKPDEMPEYYDGTAMIHFTCVKSTSKLVLHARELEISNSTLSLSSDSDSAFTTMTNFPWTYDPITHLLTVDLKTQTFKPNLNYTFSVSFKGFTTDDRIGFYRTAYLDAQNQKRWLVTSQTAFIESRKSFICFDEPSFKAKFKINIIHDASLHAMSNMPIKSIRTLDPSNGYSWIETEFDESFHMSTYLVAILVSDFKCQEGVAITPLSGSVNVSICARPNALNDLQLAYEVATRGIEFFEQFYKVEYPLPKLDHFAVVDTRFSAMENWGLILYRERNLIKNALSSQTDELNVVTTVVHEISHMWFGNLVTPKWWDDLWLNEGFARYMEHLGADFLRPNWRLVDKLFLIVLDVFQADSRDNIRPISMDLNTPDEIDSNYDPIITYGKASAIVKMMNYLMGEETFTDGLKKYFEDFKYKNVDQYDLWRTLHEKAISEDKLKDVNITNIMSLWTKQKGHPVVTVKKLNSTHISLKQNRFLLDSTVNVADLNDIKWSIPFSYSIETLNSDSSYTNQVNTSNLYDKIIWFNTETDEKIIELNRPLNDNNFIIANLDTAGYYRVNYDPQNWKLISAQLKNKKDQLSIRTKGQLLNDAFSLSEANYIHLEDTLEMVKFMRDEFDYLPWSVLTTRTKFFTDILDSTETFTNLQHFLAHLSELYYNFLGWNENINTDTWSNRFVRKSIIQFACQNDLVDCVTKSKEYFNQWMTSQNINTLPANYRAIVVCTAVRHGTPKEFNFVFDQTKNVITDVVTLNDLWSGLSCSKDASLLVKFLNDQLTSTGGRLIQSGINYVSSRPGGALVAWDWIKNNWDKLYSNVISDDDIPVLLGEIVRKLKYQEQYNDIKRFFESKNLPPAGWTIVNETLKKLKSNIHWFDQNFNNVNSWLQASIRS